MERLQWEGSWLLGPGGVSTTSFTFSEMRRVVRLLILLKEKFFIITGKWREITGVTRETDTSSVRMLSFRLAGCTVAPLEREPNWSAGIHRQTLPGQAGLVFRGNTGEGGGVSLEEGF